MPSTEEERATPHLVYSSAGRSKSFLVTFVRETFKIHGIAPQQLIRGRRKALNSSEKASLVGCVLRAQTGFKKEGSPGRADKWGRKGHEAWCLLHHRDQSLHIPLGPLTLREGHRSSKASSSGGSGGGLSEPHPPPASEHLAKGESSLSGHSNCW